MKGVFLQSILFVELLGGIGDVLIALRAIQALARSHPSAKLTVITFTPGGELLQHNPLLHQVIYAKRDQARKAVDEILASHAFDLIVSDTNYDGIAEAIQNSSAKRVVTNLWRSPPPDQRVSDRFLQILLAENLITPAAISLDQPLINLTSAEQAKAKKALAAAYRPLIFLCPDAGMAIKRWSTANFITLGQALQHQYNATVIVPIGADSEQAIQITQGIGGTTQTWERGTLRELAAVMAQADLVVGADTGPARIAAALNVPTITLFGPSWHGRYGQPSPHVNLQGYPECPERVISNFTEQNCWYSGVCPFEQWDTCLEAISPQEVLEAAANFLGDGNKQKSKVNAETRYIASVQKTLDSLNSWQSVRNILVMRLDNIGDVIMASPALRAIKENLPRSSLTLMASSGGALTAPLLPWVDQVLQERVLWQDLGRLDFNPAREWELVETLRERCFDAAIIFTSFSQSPHPAALVCYLAGIPLRLGESKELGLGVLTDELPAAPDEVHQVERNLRLIESVGFKVSDRRLSIEIPEFKIQNPKSKIQNLDVPYILLNPWTSCQSRNYDTNRFAIAARQLAEKTGWQVVVTGVEKDRDRASSLLDTLGSYAINLIGATTLSELAALIANTKLVLTNNTSTMHIADATNTPSVVLFSGTELECQWQPRYARSKLLRRPTVCSPCYAFTCPYELQCLDISPEAVVKAGLELL